MVTVQKVIPVRDRTLGWVLSSRGESVNKRVNTELHYDDKVFNIHVRVPDFTPESVAEFRARVLKSVSLDGLEEQPVNWTDGMVEFAFKTHRTHIPYLLKKFLRDWDVLQSQWFTEHRKGTVNMPGPTKVTSKGTWVNKGYIVQREFTFISFWFTLDLWSGDIVNRMVYCPEKSAPFKLKSWAVKGLDRHEALLKNLEHHDYANPDVVIYSWGFWAEAVGNCEYPSKRNLKKEWQDKHGLLEPVFVNIYADGDSLQRGIVSLFGNRNTVLKPYLDGGMLHPWAEKKWYDGVNNIQPEEVQEVDEENAVKGIENDYENVELKDGIPGIPAEGLRQLS